MTDAPDASTPDSYIGPLVNLVMQLSPLITTLATQSGDLKVIVTNLNVPWVLPLIWWAGLVVGFVAGLVWLYRRAVARQSRLALWLKGMMPWNRGG